MNLKEIRADALKKLEELNAKSERDLAALKTYLFGKSGVLTGLMKGLKDLPPEQKPQAGKEINDLRVELMALCEQKEKELHRLAIEQAINSQVLDLSIDRPDHAIGCVHPLSQVRRRLTEYFVGNGYIVYDSPEIETDYYNFQALNVPPDHPARDMQDTFFINDNILLRTQTSSGQVRLMEKYKPPIKMICPGRVFRNDDDST
ncbi:MAG: phenylalanine--tRNA ligase subunit alpha, partial [Clostridiales bacterium]|nr:phenylalanine--tRNA ligase subunit alpha [Clostridiales bacterium]